MTQEKKAPTRFSTRRSARRAAQQGQDESAAAATKGALKPRKEGVKKAKGSVGGTAKQHEKAKTQRGKAARQAKKKLLKALIQRVDARDPEEAEAEQRELLSCSLVFRPVTVSPSLPNATLPDTQRRPRRNSREGEGYMDDDDFFMDDIAVEDDGDNDNGLSSKREKCWIPDMEDRPRPFAGQKPPGIDTLLWKSYRMLDKYIYRHSLSPAEVEALPLLKDVLDFQHSRGKGEVPVTPPGFRWDEELRLVPI